MGIGIDPSLTGTGVVSVTEKGFSSERLFKSKKTGDTPLSETKRITEISRVVTEHVMSLANGVEPGKAVVCMEGLAYMFRQTMCMIQLSALNYFLRRDLWSSAGLKFYIVAPTSLKKYVTGSGKAKKDQMLMETYKRWDETFTDDNLCDAHGLARIAYANVSGNDDGLINPQLEVLELLKKQD